MIKFISNNSEIFSVVAVGVILFLQRLFSGSSGLRKQIAAEYKERNEQLELKIRLNADEITKTNLDVARLQATIVEKDKHIESLTKLNQGKNPEMVELLKEIRDGNTAVQKFIKNTSELLKKSNDELNYQTEILEKSKQRDEKIDKASKAHVGVLLRAPLNGKKKGTKSKKK